MVTVVTVVAVVAVVGGGIERRGAPGVGTMAKTSTF